MTPLATAILALTLIIRGSECSYHNIKGSLNTTCSAMKHLSTPDANTPASLLPYLVKQSTTTHGSQQAVFVIDVGANNGQTAKILSNAGADVLSFEPNPTTCAEFNVNMKNAKTNVKLVCAGVGKTAGISTFFDITKKGRSTAFMELPTDWAKNNKPENIVGVQKLEIVSLDAILATSEYVGKNVEILKIDTQGREYGVLQGAASMLKTVPTVLLEFSNLLLKASGTRPIDLLLLLQENGFFCFYMKRESQHGNTNWDFQNDDCVSFKQLIEGVKGGWTNLLCVKRNTLVH